MKVLAVIPARYQSIRFPGKPLIDIKGLSMIQRVYNQVSKAASIDSVVVATDNDEIYNHCSNAEIPVLMTSKDHKSGTDRVAEVAMRMDADLVVNVQGDEPFLHPQHIDLLVTALIESDTSIATIAAPVSGKKMKMDPNLVKVVRRNDGRALYFSRAGIPFDRDQNEMDETFLQHVGIYAFNTSTLLEIANWPKSQLEKREKLEQLRWLDGGKDILVIEVNAVTKGIDTPADLANLIGWMDRNGIS